MRRLPLVALALLLPLAHPAVGAAQNPAPARPAAPPGPEARDSIAQAARDSIDARRARRRAPRRQTVTPELDRSAYADPAARTLLARARTARTAQDSALQAYDAKSFQRVSLGLGIRRFGRDRLLFRGENASRVRWSKQQGVMIEPLGARGVSPMFKEANAEFDTFDAGSLPYFPGRETLWFPGSDFKVAQAEVDEREFLHPLATGAEAYYRYATGDSVTIRLPDGRAVQLRELRVTARRPEWRAFVGSFWFDVERGSLVRAGYRMSRDLDIWEVAGEEAKREFQDALKKADSVGGKKGEELRRAAKAELEDDQVPWLVQGLFDPARATISSITVEYGLYESRFWLPRSHVAEGEAQMGFLRVPLRFEERFRYEGVNGTASVPKVPSAAELGLAGSDTSSYANASITIGSSSRRDTATTREGRLSRDTARVGEYRARIDTLQRRLDSLVARNADSTKVKAARASLTSARTRLALAERRRDECARDSTYFAGWRTLWDDNQRMRVAVRRPCDPRVLANSPELTGDLLAPNEAVWGTAERDALLSALEKFDLQPGWGPTPLRVRSGVNFIRFNRVEGLSVGAEASSVLGLGYTASAQARLGVSDLMPNGELALARSNGRTTYRGAVFHRLGVANDDYGNPLGFGASLANLLYARDEGFYYRTWGAELTGTRTLLLGSTPVTWRVFAERQRNAAQELRRTITQAEFTGNIRGDRVTAYGAGLDVGRTFGLDPTRTRLQTRVRLEAAGLDWAREGVRIVDPADPERLVFVERDGARGYGRAMTEATLSRGLGRWAGAVTGAIGTMAGVGGTDRDVLPTQRLFYVGGLQTVRGQFARPGGPGYAGNTFWMARTELGLNVVSARPMVFYDVGWAGDRRDFTQPGRPLSGYGVGASFLDGLFRMDLSRGVWPERRTRFDVSVEARF